MSSSQRVLSGSVTKGSTATLTGSVEYFYQGVNADTLSSYIGSLLPRLGSGDRFELRKNNKPLSKETFDDSIVINSTLDDLGGNNDYRVKQEVSFSLERLAFGQPPNIPQSETFADMASFNPVDYINDQNEFMWPVNIWNLGSLPDHEFDGIIEPLDIRREALGDFDLKYEGHTIRGALVGAASEKPWGSVELSDTWSISDKEAYAFLDSPLYMSSSAGSKSTPIYDTPNWLTASFTTGSHTYTADSASSLRLWSDLTSPPDDRSPANVTLTALGAGADYSLTTELISGTREHNVWEWQNSTEVGYDFGLPSYWDAKIGFDARAPDAAYPAPNIGVSKFTIAMWIKPSMQLTTTTDTMTLVSMGQDIEAGNSIGQIVVDLSNGDTTIGDSRPDIYSKRLRVKICGGDYFSMNQQATDRWVTQDWNQFQDLQWHHVVITATVVQGSPTLNPGGADTVVTMYIDGVAKTPVIATPGSRFSAAYNAQSQMKLVDSDSGAHPGRMRFFHNVQGGDEFQGAASSPTIWSDILTADEVQAVYLAEKNKVVIGYSVEHYNNPSKEINPLAIQAYQDIRQSSLNAFEETDYHDKVYSSIILHNNEDMRSALRLLNSSSCNSFTDPLQKRATRGASFNSDVGSITFNNLLVVGEY